MQRDGDEWWTVDPSVSDGEYDYGFLIDDDPQLLPDPRSRYPARTACTVPHDHSTRRVSCGRTSCGPDGSWQAA